MKPLRHMLPSRAALIHLLLVTGMAFGAVDIDELPQIAGQTGTAVKMPSPPPNSTLTWKNGETLSGSLVAATADSISWRSSLFVEPIEPVLHALQQIDFQHGKEQTPSTAAVAKTDLKTSATHLGVRHTTNSGGEVSLSFKNQLKEEVALYYLSQNGKRVSHGRIKPGATYSRKTKEGHMWLITSAEGVTLSVFEAKASIGTVLIDGPGKPGEPPVTPAPQPKPEPAAPTDGFSFRFRDGSVLRGDVLSADSASLRVKTSQHGEITVKRSEIVSLTRAAGKSVIFDGPGKPSAWQTNNRNNRESGLSEPMWQQLDGGLLRIHSLGLKTTLPLICPETGRLELTFHAEKRPQFCLDIASPSGGLLTLETWGAEVILHGATQFISLKPLKDSDHTLALTILWDMKAKRFAAFSPDGSPLCDWQTDADTKKVGRFIISNPNNPGFKGLQLTNKCPELVIENLRLSNWDGANPQTHDAAKPSVTLLDGRAIEGSLISANEQNLIVKNAQSGAEETLPWEKCDRIEFRPEQLKDAPAFQTRLWTEGTDFLGGRLLRADSSALSLETAFSAEPVPTKIETLKTVKFAASAPAGAPEEVPLARMDRISAGPLSMHGTWRRNGDAALLWVPVGCAKPVFLALEAGPVEIFRALPADGKWPIAPGLLHLESGDILPGNITSLDATTITLDAPLLGIKELPAKLLRCAQFGSTELKTQGFQDAGWRSTRSDAKNIHRDGDTVVLDPGGGFGHPSILQASEVRFSVIGQSGMGVVRTRLFCNGTDVTSPCISLLFAHYGNTLYAGLESSEGQMQSRTQMRVNGKAACRLALHATDIEIFINNVSMLKVPTKGLKRSGLGLVFESGDLWGNGPRSVEVSDFSIRINAGKPWIPAVDATARSQALLVPRFRKESPPKHVLVAQNGDLLRGELVAATASHLAFRSGLESLQVPRNRVSAAIWLQKPEVKKPDGGTPPAEPAPPANDGSTHWLQLTSGARFGLKVTNFEQDSISGTSLLTGDCKIPMEQVFKVRTARPTPDSVSHAFDDWKVEFAPEPVLPEGGAQSSPLLGQDAKSFTLPMLAGDAKFDLAKEKGKVVVLDFWATWCGPCIKSLPELIEAMTPFPADKVQFIGVNQGESKEQVAKFLTQRGWTLKVALDAEQSVGRQFGVEGIPHTVILGTDGKVAWVKTGYARENAAEAAEAVKKLLQNLAPK
jgi:thiol-disulfide isomerase/thioredoxin